MELQVSTSFYKCGGVLIPEVQLQLLQDQHTPSLRGCSRVAWQAPMWVVVRPARSEKKATCCSYGSVNMQQGGAWGRQRRRGGVIFIFGAEVLNVKVTPAICTYKFCGFCGYYQCLIRGRWTRKYSQCLFNKPNSEIQPLHCSQKRTLEIVQIWVCCKILQEPWVRLV